MVTLNVVGSSAGTNVVGTLDLSTITRPSYLNDLTSISSSSVTKWELSVEQSNIL